MDHLAVLLMIFGPAVVGLGALVTGIVLLARKSENGRRSTAATIVAVMCLLTTLGIGACYGVLLAGNL